MAAKKMFSHIQKKEICEYYQSGFSLSETGEKFGITVAAVHRILSKANIERRSVAAGNSLKWENALFKQNQINKRSGKPSGALDKNWKIDKIVKRPTLSGDKNHFWKGGKTKLSAQIRTSAEYSFWRIQVFKRDRFTCQLCGAKNSKDQKCIFDADHIYPFSKILDDFKIKSMEEAISCEQFWDITNGRCLCRDCHKKTDSWGSKQNLITKTG